MHKQQKNGVRNSRKTQKTNKQTNKHKKTKSTKQEVSTERVSRVESFVKQIEEKFTWLGEESKETPNRVDNLELGLNYYRTELRYF